MRRLYVCPKEIWQQHVEHFHPVQGSHFIDLAGGLVLVATDFVNEASEEIWESHQDVAALPHPTFEGTVALRDHAKDPSKRFGNVHLKSLESLGIVAGDTVMDTSRKARTIHPLVRVGNLL